jgi:hypothetical protein
MRKINSDFNMFIFKVLPVILVVISVISCNSSANDTIREQFANPPSKYKPMPFWHINGELTREGIRKQMNDARDAGFGGVSLLPLAGKGEEHPGTTPTFLSDAYFNRFQDMLDVAEELDMEVILYDDNDFPSGMAGGKLGELFPEHTMKRLDNMEKELVGPTVFTDTINAVKLMAAVAMNTETLERIEISNFVKDGILRWNVPQGNWKVMLFKMQKDSWHKAYPVVDYLDSTAVSHMINLTYDKYKEKFASYFGNTIKITFFDDVGYWKHPRTWTGLFNEKFKELYGYDPKPYYPALWHNIGPDTESVRHAFFNTRAELLAEGFPRLVAKWNEDHGLKSTGHPPGNYQPQPIDMNGDIFKFFRYTQIPLTDAIINYQYGLNGHKLISSAADYYDRPLVSVEIYGAYPEKSFDSLMLYRSVMDQFVRGVNFIVPHGMWYNPDKVYIPPLVSPYSEKIAPELPAYSDYVGRSCMLLQGGRKIADIGVLYPFESLAGWFRFDNPDNIRQGKYISPETDYLKISDLLTNEIRRDFTFVHPEYFLNEKYSVEDGKVKLNNSENFQEYKVMFMSGCNIISYKTLEKLKAFYENGGTIIATTQLPYKSSELGKDQIVIDIIQDVFGLNALESGTGTIQMNSNKTGGKALFVTNPSKENLLAAFEQSSINADVIFENNPKLIHDFGKFSYIHKIKDGKNIFLFANSSDEPINTHVMLRGKHKLEGWNPHKGIIDKDIESSYVEKNGITYTKFHLQLLPVESMFFVSKQK